ncbi:hypothetical protein B0H16DRAFT_425092 [Mycena metata]|uniref:Uncharacterized protein n=1 Tax=Mycena metata TaxID=1033252 RepID=A0AAD7HEF9_9AGAR|nr:hypothetical protein B0H16DRAFT_425092 [Mycena metata]
MLENGVLSPSVRPLRASVPCFRRRYTRRATPRPCRSIPTRSPPYDALYPVLFCTLVIPDDRHDRNIPPAQPSRPCRSIPTRTYRPLYQSALAIPVCLMRFSLPPPRSASDGSPPRPPNTRSDAETFNPRCPCPPKQSSRYPVSLLGYPPPKPVLPQGSGAQPPPTRDKSLRPQTATPSRMASFSPILAQEFRLLENKSR